MIEIDNFRRQLNTADICIFKTQTATGICYLLDRTGCTINTPLAFDSYAQTHAPDPLANMITADFSPYLAWLFATMRAKVAFALGEPATALGHHRAALAHVQDPLLTAATYAEIARITYRADRDFAHDMRDAAMEFAQTAQIHGLAAKIYLPRIRVAYAFQDDTTPSALHASLTEIVDTYVQSGVDVAGLARSLNTRGVVTRRARSDSEALSDFQLAAVMAITINDPDLIQASLFNLLACLEFSDLACADTKILGSEINYWFCEHFSVGKDTAQCSLLLSQFYLEKGDHDNARMTIKRAATLMAGERNMTDMAYFFYSTAHLRFAQGAAPQTIRPRLTRAARIYRQVDNSIGTRKVARLLARLD